MESPRKRGIKGDIHSPHTDKENKQPQYSVEFYEEIERVDPTMRDLIRKTYSKKSKPTHTK